MQANLRKQLVAKKTVSKEQLCQITTETLKHGIFIIKGTPSELAFAPTSDILNSSSLMCPSQAMEV